MRKPSLILAFVLTTVLSMGCSQSYYCKLFRTETARAGNDHSFSRELLDGSIGTYGDSDLLIRVVSVWDSNNEARLATNSYSVSVIQQAIGELTDTLLIDSVEMTFRPSGERHILSLYSRVALEGYFVSRPLVKTKFRNVVIPPDVKAIEVRFLGRRANGAALAATQEYSFALTRFEAAVKKFGQWNTD
jgi:hypothetical protein